MSDRTLSLGTRIRIYQEMIKSYVRHVMHHTADLDTVGGKFYLTIHEIEEAAEQRGAERGWDEGYGACWDYHMSEGVAGAIDNPYRADQESDDE